MLLYSFIWILIQPSASCNLSKCTETSSVQRYRLEGHVLIERRAETMLECAQFCNQTQECLSVNYKLLGQICELNRADVHIAPHNYLPARGYVYLDNPWPKVKMVGASTLLLRLPNKNLNFQKHSTQIIVMHKKEVNLDHEIIFSSTNCWTIKSRDTWKSKNKREQNRFNLQTFILTV